MALLYRFLLDATETQTSKPGGLLGSLYAFIPFILIIGVMYLCQSDRRKREKTTESTT